MPGPTLEERALIDGDIDRHATRLIELCSRLQWETDASSTIEVVIGTIIRTADDLYDDDPVVTCEGIVKALVKILGADAVRAAIERTEEK